MQKDLPTAYNESIRHIYTGPYQSKLYHDLCMLQSYPSRVKYLTALLCFPAEEISRHLCGPLPRDCHFWQRAPNQLFQATRERATGGIESTHTGGARVR